MNSRKTIGPRRNPRSRVVKVESRERRRGAPVESFHLQVELASTHEVVETCNIAASLLPPWLPTAGIGEFEKPTPVRVQTRLDRKKGKRKGRVLYLFSGDQLVGVLCFHINGQREVEIKHLDARAMGEKQRLIRMRILIIQLKKLAAKRSGELAQKPLVWGPPDSDQRQLARILGFEEVHRPGAGRGKPAVFKEP